MSGLVDAKATAASGLSEPVAVAPPGQQNGSKGEDPDEDEDDGDDGEDEEDVAEGGGGDASAKKKKKKKKKKKGKKKPAPSAVAPTTGTQTPHSRKLTGFTDYYTAYGQTNPPTRPVADLFPNGEFPIGEIQPHGITKDPVSGKLPPFPFLFFPSFLRAVFTKHKLTAPLSQDLEATFCA